MPRDIPIGNGSVLVTFDREYQVRDIFYPHVGKENQAGREPCRLGVWADGQFSWMGPEWHKSLTYRDNTLVTEVTARNDRLGIELHCSDCVDYEEPLFVRQIRVKDLNGGAREVRLFFHHDLNLYEHSDRDTVAFDPGTKSIVHYKDRRYCLINVAYGDRFGVENYTTGEKGSPGREGTWKDAEDGWLSKNPAATGSVDSTVAVNLHLDAHAEQTCWLWMAFGTAYSEVKAYNAFVWQATPAEIIRRTHNYWTLWTNKEELDLSALPDDLRRFFMRNLLIIRAHADADGGIIAGSDSDARFWGHDPYSYVWPHVGAVASMGLDAAGYPELARSFFIFCASSQAEDGFLLPKYFTDGSLGDLRHPWVHDGRPVLPIQEDSTSLVIFALWRHFDRYRDLDFIEPLYHTLICNAGEFMCRHVDPETNLPQPSFDVWDERFAVHTNTTCSVIAGLWAAARFAQAFGDTDRSQRYNGAADRMKEALVRFLYHNDLRRFARCGYRRDRGYELDMTLDSSLVVLWATGIFLANDPRVISTMDQTWDALWVKTDVGGVARYEGDAYLRVSDKLPGNPWMLGTLRLAYWQIAKAKSVDELERAVPLLQWVARYALPSGVLPEQINPYTHEAISVSPAVWPQAMFAHVTMSYLEALEEMQPHRAPCRRPFTRRMDVYGMPAILARETRAVVAERALAEVT